MWPYLKDGDLIELKPIETPLRLGQLVLAEFKSHDKPALHRFIQGPSSHNWITKGDWQKRQDPTPQGAPRYTVKDRWIQKGEKFCRSPLLLNSILFAPWVGCLSQLNDLRYRGLHHIAAFCLYTLGNLARLLENWILGPLHSKWGQLCKK